MSVLLVGYYLWPKPEIPTATPVTLESSTNPINPEAADNSRRIKPAV